MISLHCTHCQQLLEMDDAFAGGVCRCQHCGTIQTVPSHLKGNGDATTAAHAGPAGGGTKALYQRGAAGAPGTGLDELAEIVASSGLSRSGLSSSKGHGGRRGHGAAGHATPGPKKKNQAAMFALLGAAAAILVVGVGFLAYRAASKPAPVVTPAGPKAPASPTAGGFDVGEPEAPVAIAGPSFGDVPLAHGSVIFLLDRSAANAEILDTLKATVYKAIESLGPERKFQAVFWHNAEGQMAHPDEGFAAATPEQVEAARAKFEDVVAFGNTDLRATLEKAAAARPEAIVIATAKGDFNLDEDTAAMVEEVLRGTSIKVHTIALGSVESEMLKQIAQKTGGEYRDVSYQKLRRFSY